MKFKRKRNETMLWIESMKTMVVFKNGVADVDEKVGKELTKLGYIEDSENKPTEQAVEETVVEKKVESIKPIKPIKAERDDSKINSEV